MIRAVFVAIIVAAGVAAAVHWWPTHKNVVEFYGSSLRASLFSGFLGLGGFLLSLKTFIVVKMKEGLYDHKLYRARYAETKKANPGNAGQLFDQLGKLRGLLFASIVCSLITATLQITLGLAEHRVAVILCLAAAGFTIAMLAQSLIQINGNLQTWFQYLEIDAQEQEKKAAETATAPQA